MVFNRKEAAHETGKPPTVKSKKRSGYVHPLARAQNEESEGKKKTEKIKIRTGITQNHAYL